MYYRFINPTILFQLANKNMSDAEVEELTRGVAAVKTSPKLTNRPASPIIDIYGDEEDSFDQGGNINVSLV